MSARPTVPLSGDASRALAHITGRTRSGLFASRLWDMGEVRWSNALLELHSAGYRIEWVNGTVADDPTVTGGWVLR